MLGLTEGSLSEIHHLSCWEAKQRIMRRALWAYLLPLLDGFQEARKKSQETGRFPRGGVEEIQGYRAGEGKRCFHVMKCDSIRAKRWASGSAVALLNSSALQPFPQGGAPPRCMNTQIEVEGRREGWERKRADIRSGTIVWELRAHPKP